MGVTQQLLPRAVAAALVAMMMMIAGSAVVAQAQFTCFPGQNA